MVRTPNCGSHRWNGGPCVFTDFVSAQPDLRGHRVQGFEHPLVLRSLIWALVQTRKTTFGVKGRGCGTGGGLTRGGGLTPWPFSLLPSPLRLQATQVKITGRITIEKRELKTREGEQLAWGHTARIWLFNSQCFCPHLAPRVARPQEVSCNRKLLPQARVLNTDISPF